MSVPKPLVLAAAIVLGLSALAHAASRSAPARSTHITRPPAGSYAGYSADPETARLQRMADQFHNTY
jgi:hypothetical protein